MEGRNRFLGCRRAGVEPIFTTLPPGGLKAVLGPQRAAALDIRIQKFGDTWAEAYHGRVTRWRS